MTGKDGTRGGVLEEMGRHTQASGDFTHGCLIPGPAYVDMMKLFLLLS